MKNILNEVEGRRRDVRFRAVVDAFSDSADIKWAVLPEDAMDAEQERDFLATWTIFAEAFGESGPKTSDDRRCLQRGVELYGGSHFSYLNDQWYMDGNFLPGDLPAHALLKAMTRKSAGGLVPTRINWAALIPVMASVSENENYTYTERRLIEVARGIRNRDNMARDALRLGGIQRVMHGYTMPAAVRWLQWNDSVVFSEVAQYHQREDEMPNGGPFAGMNRRRGMSTILLSSAAWKNGREPWVKRWRKRGDVSIRLDRHNAKPFCIRRGKMLLRIVNSNGKWKRSPLPPDPRLWALLLSWALSPGDSRQAMLLSGFRWYWKPGPEKLPLSEPQLRSLKLLGEICSGLGDKVTVNNRRLIVQGRSGCVYAIMMERGAHGAPFRIEAWRHPTALQREQRGEPLCIHAGRQKEKLPIGDTIASVVLTLVDDENSSQRIESLLQFLHMGRQHDHPGINDHLYPVHARRHAERERRMARQIGRGYGEQGEFEHGINADPPWNIIPFQQNAIDDAEPVDEDPRRENAGGENAGGGNAGNAEAANPNEPANPNEGDNPADEARIGGEMMAIDQPDQVEREHTALYQYQQHLRNRREAERRAQQNLRTEEIDRNEAAFRQLEAQGRAERGPHLRTPRWTTLFPLMNRVLRAMPLQARMSLPNEAGGLVHFRGCGFQMTIRDEEELEFAKELAASNGWTQQANPEQGIEGEEENDAESGWVRTGPPLEGALAMITRTLRPIQTRLGQRAEAPWWWSYRTRRHEVPEEADLSWDMELSYADLEGAHMDLIA